jgi:hypothetical protein
MLNKILILKTKFREKFLILYVFYDWDAIVIFQK